MSCLGLQSNHETRRLGWRPQMGSSLRWSGTSSGAAEASFGFRAGLGAEGENERPHCRQIVDFAATYSICLKPQCGHSTLALAGDDLITSSVGEGQKLTASREGRLGRFFVANNFWPAAGCRFDTHPAGNFRFPDKGGAFFNDEAGSLQISRKGAIPLQFATLPPGQLSLPLSATPHPPCLDF